MPDYRNYTPEDLAADSSFRKWVLFDVPEEKAFWEEWLELNPDKTETVEKAEKYLNWAISVFDQVTDEEISAEIYRLSHQIGENEAKRTTIQRWIRPTWYNVAASVIVLIGVGWWFSRQSLTHKNNDTYKEILSQIDEPLDKVENSTKKSRLVILPDGSTVILQPKSRISYPRNFKGKRREIFLTGEAFFEVAKNPDKPFFVYASSLATKVLGTSFKITSFDEDQEVKVVVKTGRVSVFPITEEKIAAEQSSNKLTGMILTPNQQIVFTPSKQRLTRSLVEQPAVLDLPIQHQSFTFKATPIDRVFATLEKSYGVQIVFDSDIMKNCLLTAELSDEPLFEKIDLICKTLGANYQQMDASIIISSQGCD